MTTMSNPNSGVMFLLNRFFSPDAEEIKQALWNEGAIT
jgi:hypothetical protein